LYKFNTINQLKMELYIQEYLTSDSFMSPDREYLFLDKDTVKLMRMDSVIETFDFKRYINAEFRKVQRI
jgi:hypothetical protein